jgi:hypothetical protein
MGGRWRLLLKRALNATYLTRKYLNRGIEKDRAFLAISAQPPGGFRGAASKEVSNDTRHIGGTPDHNWGDLRLHYRSNRRP